MPQPPPLIYLHGLLSNSQGFKATWLRQIFPHILTPDFEGTLDERMAHLHTVLSDTSGWVIIGSSFGGLMGALFTCQHPARVARLILLAPALIWPEFINSPPPPVAVPTVIYHGRNDTVVPLEPVETVAREVFTHLAFHVVEDDHGLHATVKTIDWPRLVQP